VQRFRANRCAVSVADSSNSTGGAPGRKRHRTRTTALVRQVFTPESRLRARAADRHPSLPFHTFATALAIIFFS